MFVSHALPGSSICDYGAAGLDDYGGDDNGTDDLVEKFLGGRQAAEETAAAAGDSANIFSRTSLPVRGCARFRAAAYGSRPGEQDRGSESQARFCASFCHILCVL